MLRGQAQPQAHQISHSDGFRTSSHFSSKREQLDHRHQQQEPEHLTCILHPEKSRVRGWDIQCHHPPQATLCETRTSLSHRHHRTDNTNKTHEQHCTSPRRNVTPPQCPRQHQEHSHAAAHHHTSPVFLMIQRGLDRTTKTPLANTNRSDRGYPAPKRWVFRTRMNNAIASPPPTLVLWILATLRTVSKAPQPRLHPTVNHRLSNPTAPDSGQTSLTTFWRMPDVRENLRRVSRGVARTQIRKGVAKGF